MDGLSAMPFPSPKKPFLAPFSRYTGIDVRQYKSVSAMTGHPVIPLTGTLVSR
jgi:hypothetical protein